MNRNKKKIPWKRRKKRTRKKKSGFLNWFIQNDGDNMNFVLSNKPKRKSIYGEPHPLRKFIVDPRDNDDFNEDRTDGFSISLPFLSSKGGKRRRKTRKKRGGSNQCAICLEDDLEDGDNTIRLSCQHFFCKDCIRGWLFANNTCPMCRSEVSQEDRNRVGGLEQYPANLFLPQQIESDSDDDYLGDILAEAAATAQWYHFSNLERWINSDDPHTQFIDNPYAGWQEDGTYIPGPQGYRGGIVSLIYNPRAQDNYIIVNYNGNQYRVVGAKVRQYLVPGSSNILIEQEGGGPEGGHIVYEKISRIRKAVGFVNNYASEADWWEAFRTPVTEEDILNDINAIPEHFEDGIDFININDIQEYFNWNKLYTEQEIRSIYLRWKRKTKREENREQNLQRADENRRRRTRNRRRDGCPLNLPNCNIQGGRKRRRRTRKKRGGWSRSDIDINKDDIGYYYDCSYRDGVRFRENMNITGWWDILHGNREWEIRRMLNSNRYDPNLKLYDESRPDFGEFEIPAEQLCIREFKPVKQIQAREGAGRRRKKTRKKQFLYNPNNPKKSFDVYIDKNPNDTISIKYTTVKDVKDTIKKLERLFKTKKYPHKRIWQVGMIMKVRLEAMNKYKKTRYKKAKNVYKRYQLSKRYFKFLSKRSKEKSFKDRKKMVFKFN